jgi:ADP-heptose:LPS heptosyltransferase
MSGARARRAAVATGDGTGRAVWRRRLLATVGWPLRRAAGPARLPRARRARPRLLVIRPDHLGDLLLATPALARLRRALPEAAITALIGPWARPVLEGRREVDVVRTCAFPGFTREPATSLTAPYRLLMREAAALRRTGYDAALILRVDQWWGALLAAAAGIPIRVGYGVAESRPFLTHALPASYAQHSVRENWRVVGALLDVLGLPATEEPTAPQVAVTPPGRAAATALLAGHGIPVDARLVAIHPGSGSAVKLWPARRWSAVADALAARLDARVVVTGSAAEAGLVRELVAGMQTPAVGAAAALDWAGLAALYARCELVLGVDSGPLHLAAAVGVPTVHLFGPTDPARFGPGPGGRQAVGAPPSDPGGASGRRGVGSRRREAMVDAASRGATHRVLQVALPCVPCGDLVAPPCGATTTPACLQALDVPTVVAAAEAAWRARGGARPLAAPGAGR